MSLPKLEPIAPRVWLLRGGLAKAMNVYLLEDEGGVVAYDAGEKGMAATIAAAAERMGGLKRVVLGHADTDHRGSAPELSRIAPVMCHPDAVEQAQGSGGRDYWNPERLPIGIRVLHGFAHRFVWDGGPVQISDTIEAGEQVAGFQVIDFSGHAPGMIGLWREFDRVALVSDTIYLSTLAGRAAPAHIPPDPYNLDSERASVSARRLAELQPSIVAPGHFGPLEGPEMQAQLERAANTPAA